MERIQDSSLTILERSHSPYERRGELTFGLMESLMQHDGRIDDLLTRVIEKEQDWRYYIGNDVFVTINAPFPCVHISKHFIPSVNGPTVQPTEVWRKQRTETDHPIVGGKRDRTETVSSLA